MENLQLLCFLFLLSFSVNIVMRRRALRIKKSQSPCTKNLGVFGSTKGKRYIYIYINIQN